ncbi:MAG: flippase-like domain-containing protein [Gemmatimonadetes bacterium]|nr:flippase-like domain-containing protein [Gemmatimonadota bacterium]
MRSWLLRLGKLAVTSGFLWYALSKVDVENLLSRMAGVTALPVLAAILCWVLMQAIGGLRWALLAHPLRLDPGWSPYIRFSFIGNFFNAFLPTFVGGDLVRGYYLTKHSGHISFPSVSTLMDRNAGVGGLILLGGAAALVADIGPDKPLLLAVVGALLLGYLLANLVLLTPSLLKRFQHALFRVVGAKAQARLENTFLGISMFRDHLPTFLGAVLLSVFIHLISISAIYFLGIALDLPLGFLVYLLAVPLVALITMVPVSIGGLGVRETSFIAILGQYGVDPELSVTLGLTWYLLIVVGGVPGLILYLLERTRR